MAISIQYGLDVENGGFLHCFAFVDGTARQIERPWGGSVNQQSVYDGHHRFHGFEYQGVTSPDGIVISFWSRPWPGE
jgi:hypothetical protein